MWFNGGTGSARVVSVALNNASYTRTRLLCDAYKCHRCWPSTVVFLRLKSNNGKDFANLVQPISIQPCNDPDGINVGIEIAGSLNKDTLLKTLNEFFRRKEVQDLASDNGLDSKLMQQAFIGFRRFCVESETLPVDLHIVLSDVQHGAGHVTDLFPHFLQHARLMFPHLDCMDELKKISDLRSPAHWYPEARAVTRKIVYHAGPTNSGKTHQALERFLSAQSGVYCGPLKLLANEIFRRSNQAGTPCDLITGEERRFARQDGEPSTHVSCTVEMAYVSQKCEVAIIDEVQMMRDMQRGWAWTRAFLGICADEVHVCGEESAVNLIRELSLATGDEFEVRHYKRLTPLKVLNRAVESLDRIRPGDCIVCFTKNHIFELSQQLEQKGIEVAIVYGTLPPGAKVSQAQKFNDPNDQCKVMIATDAIGMGLNLNIKRIIFYSLIKPCMNDKGEIEVDVISPSVALQVAGRAGRYNTEHSEGEVTTYRAMDLPLLKKLLATPVTTVERAGLHPTAEQIELFAYHLPKATLSNIIDIFITLSQMDQDTYFMCNVADFKNVADIIEHVPLPLRVRYLFCCAPLPRGQLFTSTMLLKFARQYSRNLPATTDWLCRQLQWPPKFPVTLGDLVHLEALFDVLDLYLWLSYRFPDVFPNRDQVREMSSELDLVIEKGVLRITRLIRNSDISGNSRRDSTGSQIKFDDDEDELETLMTSQRLQPEGPSLTSRVMRSAVDASLGVESATSEVGDRTLIDQFKQAKLQQKGGGGDKGRTGGITVMPGQKLTDALVQQGIISKDMLKKLQKELVMDMVKGKKK